MVSLVYVFFIAKPIYTSKSKVLPISEDGSTSNNFSGFASQLGINIPLSSFLVLEENREIEAYCDDDENIPLKIF